MEQTTSGVHSSSNYLLYSLQQQQQSEILLPNNNNSNNNKNNNSCYSAMNLTVLDRQRDRLNALQLNWQQQQQDQCLNTSSGQMHGSFFNLPRSSEMFQNNIITSDWQQAAAQNGSLMPTNRMGDENFTILSDGSAPREMVCRSLCSAVPLQQQHRLQNAPKLENGWPDLSNDEDNNNTSLIKIDGSAGNIGPFTASSCLAPFSSDPGFAERAAKFSSFNNGNAILTNAQRLSTEESSPRAGVSNESEAAKTVCRAASCPSALEDVTDDAQRFSNFAEESVLSEKTSAVGAKFANGNVVKKRKTDRNHGTNLQNMKGADSDEIKEKRSKTVDVRVKEKEDLKGGQGNSDNSGESNPKMIKENAKASETQKHDYIHVRARRGQATDSHSLAERVRREKISERMKYLQDLVPGCNKVTGKAVMLDEIINYVQSLQRQVEFLSMKLAAVNPSFEFNIDNLFAKEMIIPCGNFPSMEVSPDPTESYYIQFHQLQQASFHTVACSGLDVPSSVVSSPDTSSLRRTNSAAGPTELFVDTNFQGHAPSSWDGELQNVISMVQGRESPFASQGLPGLLEVNPTKIEM